jgi:hypothetical protein
MLTAAKLKKPAADVGTARSGVGCGEIKKVKLKNA